MLGVTDKEMKGISSRQVMACSDTSIRLPDIHKRTSSLPDLFVWVNGKRKKRISRKLSEPNEDPDVQFTRDSQNQNIKYQTSTKTGIQSLDSVNEEFQDILSPTSRVGFSTSIDKSSLKHSGNVLPINLVKYKSARSISKAPSKETVKNIPEESMGENLDITLLNTIPLTKFKKNIEANNLLQKSTKISRRRSSVTGWGRVHMALRHNQLNTHKFIFQKKLIRKFRLAVKLCIYCIRLIKVHSLRNKEHDDEISPFIKGLNFYEEEPVDLMFAKNDYKANRSMRVPEETKRILCKRPSHRTEHELYSVQIALRNIKAIAEYPQNMQRKIAEVGQYERYEAKRILLRQGHPASAYYFVLSGQAVVMVMDATRTFARPALYYNKGGEFGELAIIQGTKRNATIICKEPCELLSISKKDYKRIFMMGGEKSIGDPDQEQFIRSLNFLDGWPLSKLKEQPDKTKFLYFKRGDIVAQETMFYDWLIIVKTGSIRVLKKLKKVRPYEWKQKRTTVQFVPEKTKRANIENRETFRRHVLSELRIPLRNIEEEDSYLEEYPGKPKAFQHPSNSPSSVDKLPEIRRPRSRNGKRKRNGFQNIQGQFLPPLSEEGTLNQNTIDKDEVQMERYAYRKLEVEGALVLSTMSSEKRRPSLMEREKELMGFKEHKRTIQEDIDGIKRKDPLDVTEADLRPEFVEIQILSKGQVFGLADIILDQQPNFCIVSNGADLILIDKEFYLQNASDNLKNRLRQDLCPYPTDEEMQERLQRSVDWSAFRTTTMSDTLNFLKAKRELRASLTI